MGSPVVGFNDSTRSPWVWIQAPSKAPEFSASIPRESRIWEALLSVWAIMEMSPGRCCRTRQDIASPRMPHDVRPDSPPAPRSLRRLVRDVRLGAVLAGERRRDAGASRRAALDRALLAGPSEAGRDGAPAPLGALDRRGGARLGLAGGAGGGGGADPPARLPGPARRGRALLAPGGGPPARPAGAVPDRGRRLALGADRLAGARLPPAGHAPRPSQPARGLAGDPAAAGGAAGAGARPLALPGAPAPRRRRGGRGG